MRTSFHDWEDKQLVRIALEFENEGIRVTWDYVARRMERSRRTPRELKVRLATLKRTYWKRVRDFPRCFFSGATPGRLLLSSGEASGSRGPPRAMTRRGTAPPRTHLARSLARTSSAEQQSLRRLETAVDNSAVEQSVDRVASGGAVSSVASGGAVSGDGSGQSAALPAVEQSVETVVGQISSVASGGAVSGDGSGAVSSVASGGAVSGDGGGAVSCVASGEAVGGGKYCAVGGVDCGGAPEQHGELLLRGFAVMIEALGPLHEQDIFLDVGAGIDNVLACRSHYLHWQMYWY
ncbi:hypothetical protein GQ600_3979 [Phytophthora cactorum]|nr:hypothetical protein GQ600_3979 [Phytophthora cactorum]